MSRDEIRDFFRAEGPFDLSPCPRFSYPEDFDREKFDAWLALSGIAGNPSVEDVLVNIEVAERAGDRLLFRNAGVLFFARNVRRFFPEAYITCLLGRGADKVHILDRKDFDGGIVADVKGAMRFIERNTRTAYRIKGLRRQNIPEYPMDAVREAITNAVMHRDWFFDGAHVFVEVYKDRIEVISPGSLPEGLGLADLGHMNIRRNPLIADLLHRIDFIEKAGTGIRRIRDGARAQGCPEPEFRIDRFVTVTFRPNPEVRKVSEDDRVTPEVAGDVTPHPATPVVHGWEVTPHVTSHVIGKSIPKIRLIRAISGEMTGRQLREALDLRDVKYFRNNYLLPTLYDGLIERTVPDKPRSSKQRYRLTPEGSEYLQRIGDAR